MADHPRGWIFTSATLAVGEDFNHFRRELGLPQADARRWTSPFDFASQALLYIPKGLPADPNDPAFTEAVVQAALPALRSSGGRAFMLFTTLRALRRAHEMLRDRIGFPLLVQGTGSRGEALSLVVIDKLPFAPPDDPVLAARIDGMRAEGGNPFMELQLPQAVLQ